MAKWKRAYKRRSRKKRYGASYLGRHKKSVAGSRRILFFAKLIFIGAIVSILALFILLPVFSFTLPSPDKIVRREGFSTKILDRNGEVLYDIFADQRRTPVELEQIPEDLRNATIAIEDKNFYSHQGFDPFGMVRGLSRFFTLGYAQGGSTLTQQLVKNVLLSPERTVFRKAREFILAIQIERSFTKDEILQMYLNEAPYGGTAWGVEAASETYFGKKVQELTLVESAILAGMPQRPSAYSPYSSTPDAYVGRTEAVLRRMREDGYIEKEQEEDAVAQLPDFDFQERGSSFKAPHFVQYVQKQLVEQYGERVVEQGGLQVTTTLDLELQKKAQEIVAEEVNKVESLKIGNGAAVVLDPQTGEILAMVGSKDFSDEDYDGQVNVTVALRQPGSAIKPITYAAALEKGYTASTMLMDVPTEFPGGAGQPQYKPVNYDGEYRGPMQLRYALGNSINVVAVKLLALVGIENTLETAYSLGLSSLEPNKDTMSRVGLSLTLGGGEVKLVELANAYSAFANGGRRNDLISVLKVEDSNGKTLEETKLKEGKQVISDSTAYIISDILSDNGAREIVFGPNSYLNIPGRNVLVKTGTTNDKRDNWAVGGDTQAMVGVWVGNNDNSPMGSVASGISGATPIWRRIVLAALEGKASKSFESPDSVVTASVDSVSGYASHDGYSSRIEKFRKGTEPGEDQIHKKLKICKSDGRLATPSDVSHGNYEEKEYFVFVEEDPTGSEENLWQKGILEWLSGQNNPLYNPPTDYCGTASPVGVNIKDPGNESSNLPNTFAIKFSPDSTSKIKEARLYVNDDEVRSFSSPPYEYTVTLDDGTYEIRVVAVDVNNNEGDSRIKIGVGVEWNYEPTPSPTVTPEPTETSTPTPTP